jgi:hypothetical protein
MGLELLRAVAPSGSRQSVPDGSGGLFCSKTNLLGRQAELS